MDNLVSLNDFNFFINDIVEFSKLRLAFLKIPLSRLKVEYKKADLIFNLKLSSGTDINITNIELDMDSEKFQNYYKELFDKWVQAKGGK